MADLIKKVFVLGFFDGIHLGHVYLLQAAREYAMLLGGSCVVMTFGDEFLTSLGRGQKEIYTLAERKKILASYGFKSVCVLDEDKSFLQLTGEQFLDLLTKKAPSAIFAGSDFRYGLEAKGDMKLLESHFEDSKVTSAFTIDLQKMNGVKISSRDIRTLIADGNITQANALLGNPFFVSGVVIDGRKDGRKLGLPTANIVPDSIKLLPKNGVYVTLTTIGRKVYQSVTNVGGHPTYDDEKSNVETFVMDFSGDLYGKTIKVSFFSRIRDIMKFETKEALAKQIESDISFAKEYFTLAEGKK